MVDSVIESEGLPPNIHHYPYKGRDDYEEIWNYEHSLPDQLEYFLITNIGKAAFEHNFLNNEEHLFRNSWKDYFISTNSLLIRMPTKAHERAARNFGYYVKKEADLISPECRLVLCGSSDIHSDTQVKRPDESFLPRTLQNREDPTVVVEVALSESSTDLQKSAECYLNNSNGVVKVLITIRLQHKQEMVLRRWCIRNGAPVIDQETIIVKRRRKTRSNQDTLHFTNAPFIIPFQDLYLRQPAPRTDEGDVKLTQNVLTMLVGDTWGRKS